MYITKIRVQAVKYILFLSVSMQCNSVFLDIYSKCLAKSEALLAVRTVPYAPFIPEALLRVTAA
jgi:hypothetical protein